MSSLADLPELVGFFGYSREDDEASHGALLALRTRIQVELRGLLGRPPSTFRIWQDKEAIPASSLWEAEIKNAAGQAVFFIPIITLSAIASPSFRFELDSFLAREAELGRDDLIFPILYVDVPGLDDSIRRKDDLVLSFIAGRPHVDWRQLRYLDMNSTEVKRSVQRFCQNIRDALYRPWGSPEERRYEEPAALSLAEDEDGPMAALAEELNLSVSFNDETGPFGREGLPTAALLRRRSELQSEVTVVMPAQPALSGRPARSVSEARATRISPDEAALRRREDEMRAAARAEVGRRQREHELRAAREAAERLRREAERTEPRQAREEARASIREEARRDQASRR
jgi:hypothetical protein